ncbi:MAG: hypothetical protein IPL79_04815 [Myxococcales bacterium]|nr:hypothetical protein [Myxococcales bacterium]
MTDEEQRLRSAVARDPGGAAFLALGELLFARGDAAEAVLVLEQGLAHATRGAHLEEAKELLALAMRRPRGGTGLLEGLRKTAPPPPPLKAPDTMPSGAPSGMLLASPPAAPPTVVTSAPRPPAAPPPIRVTAPPPVAPPVLATSPIVPPPPLAPPRVTAPPQGRPSSPGSKHVPMPTPQDIVGLAARPRVVGGEKPVDAATAALHYAASMGHEHLPALLRGGLLSVPGIFLPPSQLQERRRQRRQRRWALRLVAVAAVLTLALVGIFFKSRIEQQARDAAARDVLALAETSLVAGSYDALASAQAKLETLVARDRRLHHELVLLRVRAAREVLFGIAPGAMPAAILSSSEPAAVGGRAIYALAHALASGEGDVAAFEALAGSSDPLARWLRARHLASRDQAQALAQFDAMTPQVPMAAIDRAALLLDSGELATGEALLASLEAAGKAADGAQDQALVWVEQAILRAERGYEIAAAFDILNVALDRELGPRIANMRWYAQAYASLMLDDFGGAETAIAKVAAPFEPRLRARLGILQILLGDISSARDLHALLPVGDASVLAGEFRAAIALTQGRPTEALRALGAPGATQTVRAAILRAQAMIDLRDFAGAKAVLAPRRAIAVDSLEVEVYYQMATLLATAGARDTAELERISRRSKSKLGRHVLAVALLWQGRCEEAERQLRRATEDISPEEPNPMLYRSWAAMAEQRLCVGDLAGARQYAQQTLELVDWYAPAKAIDSTALVLAGEGKKAREALLAFEATPEVLCGRCEVALAQVLVPDVATATPADLQRATAAVDRAVAKGAGDVAAAERTRLGL